MIKTPISNPATRATTSISDKDPDPDQVKKETVTSPAFWLAKRATKKTIITRTIL